ncbi:Sugar phosphate transporter domain [Dillenia turbinata]|uniref:Sugar phosphate transporter domain n=1 Tax=Dillenia turbinata TaxID=194707 RepID=A0AAN8Z9T0_9MAGN
MGKGGSISEGIIKKIILRHTYVAIWISLSFTVIVGNKYILDKKMYNWPYPISLTMIHMGFCSSIAFLLIRVLKLVEPVSMSCGLHLSSVVPTGALYSLGLRFSNAAHLYLSVSFIQMLKAQMPVAVYSIGALFKKDRYNSETIGNMIAISIRVGIAAYREAKFDTWGVILQLGAVAFEATRLMIIQILLTSKGRRNRHKDNAVADWTNATDMDKRYVLDCTPAADLDTGWIPTRLNLLGYNADADRTEFAEWYSPADLEATLRLNRLPRLTGTTRGC